MAWTGNGNTETLSPSVEKGPVCGLLVYVPFRWRSRDFETREPFRGMEFPA